MPGHHEPADRDTRFKISIQQSRATVYAVAFIVALALRALGGIQVSYVQILLIGVLAMVNAMVFVFFYRRGWAQRWPFRLEPLWLGFDMALISWAVYISGGVESLWYPWYLANIGAAAFVLGPWSAFFVAVADTGGFLVALWAHGDIQGFDATVLRPLGMMACLYAASFFFLRGTAELLERRHQVEKMRLAGERQIEELSRLASELDHRTSEVAEANLRLSEVDRLKSQFLANMSHELRTPLNSIIGFSGVLEGHLGKDLSARHSRFLGHIKSSGEHLLRIINDILDLSRIEAGNLDLNIERFSIRSVFDGITSVLQDSARARRIHFEVEVAEDLPAIEADAVRVKQILYNLVANAVKFAYEQTSVHLRARRVDAKQSVLRVDSLVLEVEDHGIGIDPKDRELIFQEFYQVDSGTDREFEGTGLGLALVKRFVELHHGVVTVDAAVGKGSHFTVILPVLYRGPEATGENTWSGVLSKGRGILVVEDDPTAYEKISQDLGEAGFGAIRARSGEEAIVLARKLQPLAITLDIVLPGSDGWDVLRQLKADPVTRDIPVIIVSLLDNRELGLTLGADDYFVKPPEPRRLARRLAELVAPGAPRRPRVLLIDDDSQLHDLVAVTLDADDYDLRHAFSGQEGVACALEHSPDVIILDLMMEGMDGFDVAAELKASLSAAKIPIVVLTARDMTAKDRQRLHGKIEALLEKGERTTQRLGPLIQDLVRRHAGKKVTDE